MAELPPGAVRLREAVLSFATNEQRAAHRAASEARKRYPARIRTMSEWLHGPKARAHNAAAKRAIEAEDRVKTCSREMAAHLRKQLRNGSLAGFAVEIAFDDERENVIVSGAGLLGKGDYRVLKALHQFAKQEQIELATTSNRRFIPAAEIADKLDQNAASVRKRVKLVRDALSKACPEKFGSQNDCHRLIESSHSGFRLHPAVRIIACEHAIEVKPPRKSHKSSTRKIELR